MLPQQLSRTVNNCPKGEKQRESRECQECAGRSEAGGQERREEHVLHVPHGVPGCIRGCT